MTNIRQNFVGVTFRLLDGDDRILLKKWTVMLAITSMSRQKIVFVTSKLEIKIGGSRYVLKINGIIPRRV
jgi:hypothetical protein